MIDSYTIDEKTPPDPASAHRLYQGLVGSLLVATGYFLWLSGGDIGVRFLLGICILYLSAYPALMWAKHIRPWFPAFEITLLTCIAFYAIPLLNGHRELDVYRESVVIESATLVVAYLAAANFAFFTSKGAPRAPRWAVQSLFPDKILRYLPLGMVLNTAYLYVEVFTDLIPYNLTGSFRALFFGLGIVCTFVLSRLWGLNRLSPQTRTAFALNLAIQGVFLISQLYLIRAISLLALGLIAYASARRKIPWLALTIAIPVLAFLHIGKADMRRIYWDEHKPAPQLLELPAYFSEWIGFSLAPRGEDTAKANTSSIFERASLIQMLCLSVDRVPETRPYLGGESYVDIPALFIPRVVWPDKPSSLMANVRLAIYFDLVDQNDPFSVSIAFGMIAESYLNFSFFGPPLLGLFLGFAFKRFALISHDVPQFSALGIFMILLTAWSFQAELVVATWLSSLFQAAVVCIGLPVAYRKFTTG